MDEKVCGKCKRVLPTSEFWQNKTNKDGLQDWCNDCMTEYNKKQRKKLKQKAKLLAKITLREMLAEVWRRLLVTLRIKKG